MAAKSSFRICHFLVSFSNELLKENTYFAGEKNLSIRFRLSDHRDFIALFNDDVRLLVVIFDCQVDSKERCGAIFFAFAFVFTYPLINT